MEKQVTQDQAIAIAMSEVWKNWSDDEIVKFQLFQNRLCMPFDRFHEAVEKVFGRSVWSHEFGFQDRMIEEYLGLRPMPTFEEICNLIPEEKRIVLFVD